MSRILFQLCFKALEQRERIRSRAREAGNHVAARQAPNLLGTTLDDRITETDLAVAGDDHIAVFANRQDGGAVPLGRLGLMFAHADLRLSWGRDYTLGFRFGKDRMQAPLKNQCEKRRCGLAASAGSWYKMRRKTR